MSRGGAREGAGAPRLDRALRRSQVQVGLTPELERYVEAQIQKTGLSRAEVVRQLMLVGLGTVEDAQ